MICKIVGPFAWKWTPLCKMQLFAPLSVKSLALMTIRIVYFRELGAPAKCHTAFFIWKALFGVMLTANCGGLLTRIIG